MARSNDSKSGDNSFENTDAINLGLGNINMQEIEMNVDSTDPSISLECAVPKRNGPNYMANLSDCGSSDDEE